jgi:thiol-disulfide isomerase/thioredoxin
VSTRRRGPSVTSLLTAVWVAVTLAAAGCGLEQDVGGGGSSGGPPHGQPAPALAGVLVDGGAFDIAAQRGHPVVVDFFASWCGPCVAQQPELSATARHYGTRVTFVGVDDREGEAAARSFLHASQVPYSAVVDADGHIFGDYDVLAPPTTVVIDQRGVVVAGYLGGLTQATLSARLDGLLGT